MAATVAIAATFAAIAASSSPAATPVGSTGATGASGVTGATGPVITTGPVAAIGSVVITRAQFDHWITVANDDGRTTGKPAPAVPVPPDYTDCISSLRSEPAQAGATDAALEQLCAARYQTLVFDVMTFLIQAVWIEGEANARNVSVTPGQINASYALQRRTAKPSLATASELTNFLAKSGQTRPDLKWRTRLNLLAGAIVRKVVRRAEHVSAAQISAYYAAHRSTYAGKSLRAASSEIRKVIAATQSVRAENKLHMRYTNLWRGRTICLSGFDSSTSCARGAASVAANPAAKYPGTIVAPPSATQTLAFPTTSG
ncbi:MAG TPA: hypothetical protein VGG41_19980 [Solirubrobacteraceae bacterium]